jgi:hypothetical protein
MPEFDIGDQPRVRGRFMLNKTELQQRVDDGALTIHLYAVSGLAAGDTLLINPGGKTQESRVIASLSGLSVVLTTALSFNHAAGEIVAEVVDPSTVVLAHHQPGGVTATYTYAAAELTKESVGVYSRLLTLTTAGKHVARFTTTGPVVLMEEQTLIVRASAF